MSPVRLALVGESSPLVRFLDEVKSRTDLDIRPIFTSTSPDSLLSNGLVRTSNHVLHTSLLNTDEGLNHLKEANAQWLFSMNHFERIDEAVIKFFQGKVLNFHAGKLPQYAGMYGYQWAIRNGEAGTAATLHWVTPELDGGEIVDERTISIAKDDTGLVVLKKILDEALPLFVSAIDTITRGQMPTRTPQESNVKRTVYRKSDSLIGTIDWSRSSVELFNFIRAADYFPFECPSYVPTAIFNGVPFQVLRAIPYGENKAHSPSGTYLDNTENGWLVSVGKQDVLLILKVRKGTEPWANCSKKLALTWGLQPGVSRFTCGP